MTGLTYKIFIQSFLLLTESWAGKMASSKHHILITLLRTFQGKPTKLQSNAQNPFLFFCKTTIKMLYVYVHLYQRKEKCGWLTKLFLWIPEQTWSQKRGRYFFLIHFYYQCNKHYFNFKELCRRREPAGLYHHTTLILLFGLVTFCNFYCIVIWLLQALRDYTDSTQYCTSRIQHTGGHTVGAQ